MKYAKIVATGSYLPTKTLTNKDLENMVDTSDEWIIDRTGIRERHIVAEGETTSDMAYRAALSALSQANMRPDEIDLIIVATSTPDSVFPSTACILQNKLGINREKPGPDSMGPFQDDTAYPFFSMSTAIGPGAPGDVLHSAFEAAGAALATADPTGRITWANAAFHALHGVPPGGLRDVLLRDLAVSRAGASSPFPETLASGFRGVVRLRRLDGTVFFADLSVTACNGGLAIAARDVTAERRAEAAHECLRALLRTVRESPSPAELFPIVHALLVRLVPAPCLAVVGLDPETARVELLYAAPEELGEDVHDALWAVADSVLATDAPVLLGPDAW